jgi:uncharacterized membrane protein YccC
MSAAREYKDVLAGLTAAADELRERDRERATALARRLVELDEAMARAGDRAAVTRFVVALHWEAALEALWAESWLTLRPQPAPDPAADPADLDALDAAVGERSAELQEAVRRRRLGLRHRPG